MSRYRFIQAEQANYPVTILCRVLHIARSGYYAWARRRVSARATADQALTDQIALIHARRRHCVSRLGYPFGSSNTLT